MAIFGKRKEMEFKVTYFRRENEVWDSSESVALKSDGNHKSQKNELKVGSGHKHM